MSQSDQLADFVDAAPILGTPNLEPVMEALARDGADVRFVGGCVRDLLLGRDTSDIDIATPDQPEDVIRLLEEKGIKVVPTGLGHGTVTAVLGGKGFEVTTLRVDVRTDGRHAEVTFTDDWQADAARRDFTVNAMSLKPTGALYDYFGGREDLARGRIRFVGDASRRVAEDYLRVLRYFRFLAHYASGPPDAEALVACATSKDRLSHLAAERIQIEVVRLMSAPDPVPALKLMAETGILVVVLPEAGELTNLAALTGIDDRDPIRRIAALVPSAGKAVARRLKFSNAIRRRLGLLAPPVAGFEADWPVTHQRQILYDLGPDTFRDLVLLAWAADRGGHAGRWRAMLETANGWDDPRFPIRGADVVRAGVKPGPQVRMILQNVERWWRDEDFRPSREACLDKVRTGIGELT